MLSGRLLFFFAIFLLSWDGGAGAGSPAEPNPTLATAKTEANTSPGMRGEGAQASRPEAPGEDHEHSEEEGEEGHVKLTTDQIASEGIEIGRVEAGEISQHIKVPGTIVPDADRIARVPARVVGTVAEMRKRLGDRVEKGEIVAVLDSREVADAKSEYLTASVKADLEKTNYDRQQALWDKRISAESNFLNAKAVYAEARLRQDLARQKLSALGLDAGTVAKLAKQDELTPNASTLRQYDLRSPIAGRIVERKVDVGAAVGKEGDPPDLYTVADLSTVWVDLAVPTSELDKVKEGARVTVAASQSDHSRERASGKVIFVSPLLNAETRSARVIAALPNPDFNWRPGTYVTAEVHSGRDKVKALVPKQALQTIGGKKVVFIRTETGFEVREVQAGKSDDGLVEISAGLKPGEEIAVANTFLLKAELGKGEAEHAH
ncbi:efflux RND transporter periplasmic adaptor subunit [Chelatococcus reniformis]|uniref:Cytochrome-c peroxidase n=1 Tax=Chelatococcus reniformis TaxID=1494448 RepID=A0A916XFU6_9HYPH|nr:efflux RND transporter periplasmic adaptor subunit [Chelatococcus reniformis]GGC68818.1 cytochrome-c peroxidase [Chelatococcus reniformis]